jgi:hypothetical protein
MRLVMPEKSTVLCLEKAAGQELAVQIAGGIRETSFRG